MLHSKIAITSKHMSNQVIFRIWSWYHKNGGSCVILFGHYAKNNYKLK